MDITGFLAFVDSLSPEKSEWSNRAGLEEYDDVPAAYLLSLLEKAKACDLSPRKAKKCKTLTASYGEGFQLTTNLWGNVPTKDVAILLNSNSGTVTVVRTSAIR